MRVKRRAAERVHSCWGPRIFAGLLSEQRIPTGVPTPQAWGQWAAWAPKIRRRVFRPRLWPKVPYAGGRSAPRVGPPGTNSLIRLGAKLQSSRPELTKQSQTP